MGAGLFVTGTDTGVGKTVVACALVRALRKRGIDVGVLKACETGVAADGPLDAVALSRAAGEPDPLDTVCHQQFALPAAPVVAARHAGRAVDHEAIARAFAALSARHAMVVVEGAGGLLVPTGPGATMADLAGALGLPLLVVTRTSLGTINHTLLTLSEAARRGLDVLGVVASHVAGPLSHADQANFDWLREHLGERLLGEIPPLDPGALPPAGCLRVDRVAAHCGLV